MSTGTSLLKKQNVTIYNACVRGSPMVPLVCNICTNLIANGTMNKEIGANGNTMYVPMEQMLPTNGTVGRTPENTQYESNLIS